MLKITLLAVYLAIVYAEKQAAVYLFDPSGVSGVSGNVTFKKTDNGIVVSGTVTGLAEGKHGFHVHSLGHISPGCGGTGGHFNPHNVNHGSPQDKIRHVGDLGNIVADSTGVANIDIKDSVIDLEGEHNIIGRAVVVHAGEDDLGKGGHDDSLTTGHAGGRLACGVIGRL
ncbi:superoxide dismutase [Cu-Zn]-like [Anoplophora glabripennis]|uniref:superoxide dismutase [Cu-Zn]-like n=1 Tax=Anoplophora glabripennis TaxID=217634 RepID=UPI000873DFDD|nr:superoxide dismutase [Cu-Zn]-like [Anoplophora glabripennis]